MATDTRHTVCTDFLNSLNKKYPLSIRVVYLLPSPLLIKMKSKMNKVDAYIEKNEARQDQLIALRSLLLETGMEETLKWGMPAYCVDNKNVIGLAAFKNWSTLWFHKGVYLKDEKKLLFNAQAGKTKEMRQWRFTNVEEIEEQKEDIALYLREAMEYQKVLNDMVK